MTRAARATEERRSGARAAAVDRLRGGDAAASEDTDVAAANPYAPPQRNAPAVRTARRKRGGRDYVRRGNRRNGWDTWVDIHAGLWVLQSGVTLLLLLFVTVRVASQGFDGPDLVALLLLGAVSLLFVFAFLGGIAIIRRKRWGKAATIILGVLSLLGFPLGTLLGVMTLIGSAKVGQRFTREGL